MQFKIEKKLKNSLGRAGVLKTAHGEIQTPAFVPVGTKASVKALTPYPLTPMKGEWPARFDSASGEALEAEGIGALAKIDENGVSFKSHLDGSIHYITPEKSIQIQHNLGADIIFAFDECTSPAEDLKYQEEALERTHRWAERSLTEHSKLNKENRVALFGIVQGGREGSLRKKSANFMMIISLNSKRSF